MPVQRKLASDYRDEIETGIITRDNTVETQFGPVRDIIIRPAADVFEDQNADIISVEQLQLLSDPDLIDSDDLDELAFNNWQIKRLVGSKATGSVVFRTSVRPLVDATVAAKFPVATLSDGDTGEQVQFITIQSVTLPAATADLFFNSDTGFYELESAIEAKEIGEDGKVAANRITVPQRPLVGFTSVTNVTGTVGGTDQESNASVIERIQIARSGTDISTPVGIESTVREGFVNVNDIIVVYGNDPLLVRAVSDAGAVDSYIKGAVATQTIESFLFDGGDSTFLNQPADSISTVFDGLTTFVQGVDYQLTKDTGPEGGSTRAVDKLEWLAGATPAVGVTVTVTFDINQLIVDLQTTFDLPINLVLGRNLLFKEALDTPTTISVNLSVLSGFSPSAVQGNVRTAIKAYIDGLGLGDNVERFDVSAEVFASVQGVDNLVYTIFDFLGGSGVQDLTIEKNEFATLQDVDLVVTLV